MMQIRRSSEPEWDNQFAEMLVEVSHTSQSKEEQQLEDLRHMEGNMIGADRMWDPTTIACWILAALAPKKHSSNRPLNIQAREVNLPGLMHILARVSACVHAWIFCSLRFEHSMTETQYFCNQVQEV